MNSKGIDSFRTDRYIITSKHYIIHMLVKPMGNIDHPMCE